MIIGGVLMTFLLNVLLAAVGRWAIDTFYMSESAVEARNQTLFESLQQYITEHDVASTDYEAIEAWFGDTTDADLIIYEEDDFALEAGSWGHERLSETELDNVDPAKWGYSVYSLAFANGSRRIALADCSELTLQSRVRTLVMVLSFLAFVGTLLTYSRRITRDLSAFSHDVAAVSSGESVHVDEKREFRELSGLAEDVNHMHDVITDRTRRAQSALQANRELITALSHDIRNPLTSLIGYLDLLEMESETMTEAQRQYLSASVEKADRIRALTDEMFRYFLIFSEEKPRVQTDVYDAQILLEQMLGEHAIELDSLGYTVVSDALKTPCSVRVDIEMLHRVLENIFSNIRKYADPAKPVRLSADVREGMLLVQAANAVCEVPPHNVESNRVGLRTCAAILELLGGTFSAGEADGTFTVCFTLPLEES